MKLTSMLPAVIVSAGLFLYSCAPKDADIKAQVNEVIQSDSLFNGATADVKDGVVTITGQMKDSTAKDLCAKTIKEKDIKGIIDVVNKATVMAAPQPAPAIITANIDAPTQQKIKEELKDIKGITVTVDSEKVTLVGEVNEADRIKIMRTLAWAKVRSNVDKLITK